MKTLIAFFLLITIFNYSDAQDKPAYKLFNSEGKEVKWKKMIKELQSSDMVFFGELHNNPICHWLEYELMLELFNARGNQMVIGAEMFESDNQMALNEYLMDSIDDKKFDEEARLWKNFKTDYKPMVDFAREYKLPFIATNVPRKYASAVFKGNFAALDTLKPDEYKWIAPLPIPFDINLSSYQGMLAMGDMHPEMKIDEKYPKAQAVKDATMAHFILKNKKENGIFYHINGSYHTDHFEGIIWYIRQSETDLKIMTITSAEQDDISKPDKELLGKASYILVIPSTMTKTY